MPRTLVIPAHPQPEHSRANRALADAAPAAGIELRVLYARYPDYLIDVAAEQAVRSAGRCPARQLNPPHHPAIRQC